MWSAPAIVVDGEHPRPALVLQLVSNCEPNAILIIITSASVSTCRPELRVTAQLAVGGWYLGVELGLEDVGEVASRAQLQSAGSSGVQVVHVELIPEQGQDERQVCGVTFSSCLPWVVEYRVARCTER